MVSEDTEQFPGIDQIEAFYIIHSADTTRDGESTIAAGCRKPAMKTRASSQSFWQER